MINAYQVVRDSPDELIKQLEKLKKEHSQENYYQVRELDRKDSFEKMDKVKRAARFIYLIKTGYNGLWRVNKQNQNNVPFGSYKNPKIVDEETILNDSEFLKSAKILNVDFEKAVSTAKKGDLVYFDPPYFPLSKTSSFTSYTHDNFTFEDQVRLRDLFVTLKNKGVHVILSNSNAPEINKLYKDIDGIKIYKVNATRSINSDSSNRNKIKEILIVG